VEPHVPRLTLNPAVVTVARDVLVVTLGPEKAEAVAAVFAGDPDPRTLPARLARRDGATWILDEAAAARLPR
jgi:6-phosphogluconolactonase/glucosamine-6-phosphate isomerase/deaminase